MHGQVIETDVAQELNPVARFLQDVRGDLPLEIRELQRLEPGEEPIDGKLADGGDVLAGDTNLQCLRLELRPLTVRTLASRLISTQKDADVLLVLLLLEIDQEGKNSLVAARARVQEAITR